MKQEIKKENNTTRNNKYYYNLTNNYIKQQTFTIVLNKPEIKFTIYDIEEYILNSDKFVTNCILKLYTVYLLKKDQDKKNRMERQCKLFDVEVVKNKNNKLVKIPENFNLDPRLRAIARNILIKNKIYLQDIKKARIYLLKYTNFITDIANGDLSFVY